MTKPTCSVDGCTKPAIIRGMCRPHCRRWVASHECGIDGCSRPQMARGWCEPHLLRWREHGDPLGGKPLRPSWGAGADFISMAAAYDGDDCLPWPYGQNSTGYGLAYVDGKVVYAHREVLTRTAGPPPFARAEAAHAPIICHNPLCINPRHLRWATREENMADTKLDGTFNQGGRCWARKGNRT